MPSTYSTRLRLELQAAGENANTWGDKANTVFRRLEESITGVLAIAAGTSVSAPISLTYNNGSSDQARYAYLNVTGQLASAIPIHVSAVEKGYWINNQTSGQPLLFGVVGRTPVTLESGWNHVVTDGSASWLATSPVSIAPGQVYLTEASASSAFAFKALANTFLSQQTFQSSVVVSGAAVFTSGVRQTGPITSPPIYELQATQPAYASATAGSLLFTAADLVGTRVPAAALRLLVESAQAASVQSRLEIMTKASTTALAPVAFFSRGLVLANASGGDIGHGMLNAKGVYIEGAPVLTSAGLPSNTFVLSNTGSGLPVTTSVQGNTLFSRTLHVRYFTYLDNILNNTNNVGPLGSGYVTRAFIAISSDSENIYFDCYQYYNSTPPDSGGGG